MSVGTGFGNPPHNARQGPLSGEAGCDNTSSIHVNRRSAETKGRELRSCAFVPLWISFSRAFCKIRSRAWAECSCKITPSKGICTWLAMGFPLGARVPPAYLSRRCSSVSRRDPPCEANRHDPARSLARTPAQRPGFKRRLESLHYPFSGCSSTHHGRLRGHPRGGCLPWPNRLTPLPRRVPDVRGLLPEVTDEVGWRGLPPLCETAVRPGGKAL